MHSIQKRKILMLRPSEIMYSPMSVRRVYEDEKLKELAQSIASSGVIEPIAVRKNSKGEYEVVSGERRLRAARMTNLRRIPCILHHGDQADALIFCLLQNIQRSQMSYFDEAYALKYLLDNFRISKRELSIRLGISLDLLMKKMEFLRFSDVVREKIEFFSFSEDIARQLLRLPPEKREEAAEKIGTEEMSFSDTQNLVNGIILNKTPPVSKERAIEKTIVSDIRIFSNSMVKLVDAMRKAGFSANFKKTETDKYTEYKIRINKNHNIEDFKQLKIC